MSGPVVAVVLAGGLARRLGGGDKALRPLDGRALLDHVLDRIRPQVQAVALNANGDPARFAPWRLPVLADPLEGNPGPLVGVLAGMRWGQLHHPGAADLLSVPVDAPFLPCDLVTRMWAARHVSCARIIAAASAGRVHPVVALWPVDLADDLEAALRAGMRKVETWAARHGAALATFDTAQGDPFFNVNRPEDLVQAERIAAQEG